MKEHLKSICKSIFAGIIIGIISSICAIAYAGLIFNGPLSQYLMIGASSCLIGSVVLAIILGVFSSSKRTIGQGQDVFAAIAAVICYDIAQKVAEINQADTLPTVIATIMIMAFTSGATMLVLGQLKLGKLIRFFPYPVIGGFLAATGWLIFCQSIYFLTSTTLSIHNLPYLFSQDMFPLWLIPMCYAVFMIWLTKLSNHYLILPSLVIGAIVLFYVYLLVAGLSFSEAVKNGWMMGPFPSGTLANIPSLNLFDNHIQWKIIATYVPDFLILITLSIISLLLNVSSFEIMSNETMDIDKELKATGSANLLTGLLGGLGGYQGIAASKVNLRLKLNTRMIGIFSGVFIVVILMIGTSSLSYLPKYAFGALLLFLAFDFLFEWIIEIKKKVSWPNYFIVLSIAVIISFKGFLTGLLVGLILSLVLFIIRYSTIDVIRTILTGDLIRSTVERNESEKLILGKKGNEILIPVISGYLFFGNTAFIMNKIINKIDTQYHDNKHKISYITLDFSRVTGMEVSCFMSLIKLLQNCKNRSISVVFANLPLKIKTEINRFIKASLNDLSYLEFEDLDHAIEYCEDQLISEEKSLLPLEKQFQFLSATQEENKLLLTYFEQFEVENDSIIYKQGEPANDLIYLAKGNLSVFINYGTKHQTRLTKIREGAIVGEMGLFLKEPRSASVIATEPCVLYKLTDESLKKLYVEQPELGIALDTLIIKLLGRRIMQANKFTSFVKMSL